MWDCVCVRAREWRVDTKNIRLWQVAGAITWSRTALPVIQAIRLPHPHNGHSHSCALVPCWAWFRDVKIWKMKLAELSTAKAYCVCNTYAIKHFMHLIIIIIIHKYMAPAIRYNSAQELNAGQRWNSNEWVWESEREWSSAEFNRKR